MAQFLSNVSLVPARQRRTNKKKPLVDIKFLYETNLFRFINDELTQFRKASKLAHAMPYVLLANKFTCNTIYEYCSKQINVNSLLVTDLKRTQYVSCDYEKNCHTNRGEQDLDLIRMSIPQKRRLSVSSEEANCKHLFFL